MGVHLVHTPLQTTTPRSKLDNHNQTQPDHLQTIVPLKMLVNKVTMSKAFAWGKPPAEKQKEVMTPSAASSTGQEPKIHHGSSTWFSPSTGNGLIPPNLRASLKK